MIVFLFHSHNLDKHNDVGYRPSYELRIRGISLFAYLTTDLLGGQYSDQVIFLMPSNNGAEWFVRNELAIANIDHANIKIIEYEYTGLVPALLPIVDLINDTSLPVLLVDNSHIRVPGKGILLQHTTSIPTVEFAELGPTGYITYPRGIDFKNSIDDCLISLGKSVSSGQLVGYLSETALARSVFNSYVYSAAEKEDLNALGSNKVQLLFEPLWRHLGIAEYSYKSPTGIGYLLPSSEIIEQEDFASIFSFSESSAYAVDYSTTVLDYNGRYPSVYRLPKGVITRHGILSAEKNILAATTLANIYPAQSSEHIKFTGDNITALLGGNYNQTRVACAALASNSWDRNYQHFLIDTLPKIEFLDAHLSSDVAICVSDTSFSREISEIAYPKRRFIYLSPQDVVIADNIAWGISSLAANMSPVTDVCSKALAKLRGLVLKNSHDTNPPQTSASPRAYISRRSFHENVGNSRVLLNDSDLAYLLGKHNFLSITFEGLSLGEKALLLSGRKLFISPVGANLMNLLFCHDPYHLSVIMHPVVLRHLSWFSDTLRKSGSPLLSCEMWDYAIRAFDRSPSDQHPYFVDIPRIEKHLNEEPYV
jgi:hypothetical protein